MSLFASHWILRNRLGFFRKRFLLQLVLLHAVFFLPSQVQSQEEKENLLQGLNNYRISLNLPAFLDNKNGDCYANELASQLKDRPCSNIPGMDTFPGMAPQFSNYRQLLRNCHLNSTTTQAGAIMAVCVPDLIPNLVLTKYTNSIYTQYLNDESYTGAGIGSAGDWTVVVLTKNTVEGSFAPASSAVDFNSLLHLSQKLTSLLWVSFFLLLT